MSYIELGEHLGHQIVHSEKTYQKTQYHSLCLHFLSVVEELFGSPAGDDSPALPGLDIHFPSGLLHRKLGKCYCLSFAISTSFVFRLAFVLALVLSFALTCFPPEFFIGDENEEPENTADDPFYTWFTDGSVPTSAKISTVTAWTAGLVPETTQTLKLDWD